MIAKLLYPNRGLVAQTELIFYQEASDEVPVLDWLEELRQRDRKAYANRVAIIERLAELGHELRRPAADFLGDGIHELRARRGRVHYRILYFFCGRNVAVLAHGLTKKDKVPDAEVSRALRRKKLFEEDAQAHTYQEKVENGQE